MRFAMTLAAITLASLPLTAADVTGRWSGAFTVARPDGTTQAVPALVMLKQDGTTLTGTIGRTDSDQRPFRNGKVDGDRVTFEIESANGTLQRFDLKASPDQIEGDVRATTSDGEQAVGRLALKRAPTK